MLHKVSELKGFTIGATDGEIGKITDVYFDDDQWTVRYLVVDTGKWLPGRKTLLSPAAFTSTDWDGKMVQAKLTRKQVQESPDIDTEKPVSRQQETAFYDYYQKPYYWVGPYIWGPVAFPRELVDWTPSQAKEIQAAMERKHEENSTLRSASEVSGYYVEASDGDIGHIEDLMIDDDSWTIRYGVIDTRNWWPGKKVLLSPKWIKRIGWNDHRVHIDVSRDQVKGSPEYEPSKSVTRDYETALYRHYHRQDYWSR